MGNKPVTESYDSLFDKGKNIIELEEMLAIYMN
jgi:hypothetical protein